jgi:hypothetical protein
MYIAHIHLQECSWRFGYTCTSKCIEAVPVEERTWIAHNSVFIVTAWRKVVNEWMSGVGRRDEWCRQEGWVV